MRNRTSGVFIKYIQNRKNPLGLGDIRGTAAKDRLEII
jgi:hypothetical protein